MKLKELVQNEEHLKKLTEAFADFKDDIEYDHDGYNETIKRLRQLHVDNRNNLSNLVIWSKTSSGIIKGERGTGKTHLMILAHDYLSRNIVVDSTFPVYINLKKIAFSTTSTESINRVLSIHLYRNIKRQLVRLLMNKTETSWLSKMKQMFSRDHSKLVLKITAAIEKIVFLEAICACGDTILQGTSEGQIKNAFNTKEIEELIASVKASMSEKGVNMGGDIKARDYSEISSYYDLSNNIESFLSLDYVKSSLVELLNILSLDRMVFYIDEWEKLYQNPSCQEIIANYIDKINGNPIYFWISVVPYRGSLYSMSNGADFQNEINLNKDLVYELSHEDRGICLKFFQDLIDKRLNYYLKELELDHLVFFRLPKNFERIVIASMGNSRDFGAILWGSINEFLRGIKNHTFVGRPFEQLSVEHINTSIKQRGTIKASNIETKIIELQLFDDLKNFCIENKLSHFTVEVNKTNLELLNRSEISELLYQRLLHLRKVDLTDKLGNIEKNYYLFAIDFSTTYKLHTDEKRIKFCLEYESIHNKVRGIQYNIAKFFEEIDFEQGKILICPQSGCGKHIDVKKFETLINLYGVCPFCSKKINQII